MAVIGYLAPHTIRRRLGPSLVLLLVVAAATAGSVAAWAGASRTAGSYDRLLAATHAPDVTVDGVLSALDPAAFEGIDGIAEVELYDGFAMQLMGPDGLPDFEGGLGFAVALHDLDRPLLVDGRMPEADDPSEIVVGPTAAGMLGGIGADVDVMVFNVEELFGRFEGAAEPSEEEIRVAIEELAELRTLVITGVVRHPDEIARSSDEEGDAGEVAWVSPAFGADVGVDPTGSYASVLLRDSTDLTSVLAALQGAHPGSSVELQTRNQAEELVDDAVRPIVQALRLFALALAGTAILVLAQAISREAEQDAVELTPLGAIGVARVPRRFAAMLRAAAIGCVGGLIGLAVALAASSRFPVGPVRGFDPDRGLRLEPTPFAVAAVLVVSVSIAGAAVGAIRAERRAHVGPASSRARRWVEAAHLPIALDLGTRAALVPRRDGQSGPFTRLFGSVVAVTTCAAALTFGAGLERMAAEPDRYGWTWDALLDTFDTPMGDEQLSDLRADDRLAAVDIGTRGTVAIGARSVAAYGLEPLEGTEPLLRVRRGRPASTEAEVVLGARTMDRAGLEIGDHIDVIGTTGETSRFEVVGEAIFPAMGIDSSTALSDGAAFTGAGMAMLTTAAPTFALVDLATGLSVADVAPEYEEIGALFDAQRPGEVVSYEGVRSVPLLLALVLGLLGAGVVGHGLLSVVTRGRHELAILYAVGLRRRQLASTVRWHALVVAAAGLTLGLPIGVALGRGLWQAFTEELRAGGPPVTPWPALLALVAAAGAVALGVAVGPAHMARRIDVATALRHDG